MGKTPSLLTFLLARVARWIHRRQLMVIELLKAENRALKERLKGHRIMFTDAQRASLARKAKPLSRKEPAELDLAVLPDTLMRWYRPLVAQKPDYSDRRRRVDRPGLMREILDQNRFVERQLIPPKMRGCRVRNKPASCRSAML